MGRPTPRAPLRLVLALVAALAALPIGAGAASAWTLSGTVGVDPVGAPALSSAGICVYVEHSSTFAAYETLTDAEGDYAVDVPNGVYQIGFSTDGCAGGSRANIAPGDLSGITVADGPSPANDVVLRRGAVISGMVLVPPGFEPESICVYAYDMTDGLPTAHGSTDAAGAYTISRLPAGSYDVVGDASCAPDSPNLVDELGSGVTVSAAEVRSGVETTMVRGGAISGAVRVPAGFSAAGICLYLYAEDAATWTEFTETGGAEGAYRFERLRTGSYEVRADPGDAADQPAFCTSQPLLESRLTGISVTIGEETAHRDITLAAPATAPGSGSGSGSGLAAAPAPAPTVRVLPTRRPTVTSGGGAIETVVTAPGPGTVTSTGTATARARAGRAAATTTICRGRVTVAKAGQVRVRCRLNAVGRRLNARAALSVTMATTFASTTGERSASTRTVTLPQRRR